MEGFCVRSLKSRSRWHYSFWFRGGKSAAPTIQVDEDWKKACEDLNRQSRVTDLSVVIDSSCLSPRFEKVKVVRFTQTSTFSSHTNPCPRDLFRMNLIVTRRLSHRQRYSLIDRWCMSKLLTLFRSHRSQTSHRKLKHSQGPLKN